MTRRGRKHFFCTAQDPAKITLLSWTDKAHTERETHRKRGSQKEGATWRREREIKEAKREYQREEEAERKRETFLPGEMMMPGEARLVK